MKSLILRHIIIISLVLIIPILYFNCSDNSVSPTQSTQFCITATLSGWIPGNKTLYADIYSKTTMIYSVANCSVDNQGNFNLCFPSSMSDTSLFRADSIFFFGCSGGTASFNPPDARGVELFNFRVKIGDTIVGAADYKSYTNSDSIKAGDFEVTYVFVNKNVTGSGYEVCGTDSLFFNGTVQAGWNKVVIHYLRVSPTSRTILYDSNQPAGAVWRYHGS